MPNTLLFAILACFWSGSFIGIKEAVTFWPPLFSAAIRVSIALVFLMMLMLMRGKDFAIPFRTRWKIWMVGLFSQSLPFAFLFWGERFISPGLTGILNGTVPIWTLLLSFILFPKPNSFSLSKTLGVMLGMIGIIVIFFPLISIDKHITTLWGACSVLGMAICYAIGAILNQHFLTAGNKVDFLKNIYHQHWASVIFLFITSFLWEKWPDIHTLTTLKTPWLASLYLGIFSTAIAWSIYYHLIRQWDALRASTVMYIMPILAIFWDFLFYGTVPVLTEMYGIILILLGVVMTQSNYFKQLFSRGLRPSTYTSPAQQTE